MAKQEKHPDRPPTEQEIREEVLKKAMMDDIGMKRVEDLPMENGENRHPHRGGRGPPARGARPLTERGNQGQNQPQVMNQWQVAIETGAFDDDDAEAVRGLDDLGGGRSYAAVREQTAGMLHTLNMNFGQGRRNGRPRVNLPQGSLPRHQEPVTHRQEPLPQRHGPAPTAMSITARARQISSGRPPNQQPQQRLPSSNPGSAPTTLPAPAHATPAAHFLVAPQVQPNYGEPVVANGGHAPRNLEPEDAVFSNSAKFKDSGHLQTPLPAWVYLTPHTSTPNASKSVGSFMVFINRVKVCEWQISKLYDCSCAAESDDYHVLVTFENAPGRKAYRLTFRSRSVQERFVRTLRALRDGLPIQSAGPPPSALTQTNGASTPTSPPTPKPPAAPAIESTAEQNLTASKPSAPTTKVTAEQKLLVSKPLAAPVLKEETPTVTTDIPRMPIRIDPTPPTLLPNVESTLIDLGEESPTLEENQPSHSALIDLGEEGHIIEGNQPGHSVLINLDEEGLTIEGNQPGQSEPSSAELLATLGPYTYPAGLDPGQIKSVSDAVPGLYGSFWKRFSNARAFGPPAKVAIKAEIKAGICDFFLFQYPNHRAEIEKLVNDIIDEIDRVTKTERLQYSSGQLLAMRQFGKNAPAILDELDFLPKPGNARRSGKGTHPSPVATQTGAGIIPPGVIQTNPIGKDDVTAVKAEVVAAVKPDVVATQSGSMVTETGVTAVQASIEPGILGGMGPDVLLAGDPRKLGSGQNPVVATPGRHFLGRLSTSPAQVPHIDPALLPTDPVAHLSEGMSKLSLHQEGGPTQHKYATTGWGTSAVSTTVPQTRIRETTASQSSVQQAPVQQTTAQRTPVQQEPVRQEPVQKTPAQRAPVQQAPIQRAPVQQALVQRATVQKTPAQRAPVQQAPVQYKYKGLAASRHAR
ncbi:hypothetical protein B0H67DRAFT_643934 [Lasiosphaeris hirsuta]|uniref:Uncharacterized protein n=1 Tax=Lasiosphaeris hirsuta TaxID=260670 RepID=A0AA40ARN5_9PEZI|nr:hypothetical protein B0H67DRAFT_643934 [Lasiosphaeris hirsuta]